MTAVELYRAERAKRQLVSEKPAQPKRRHRGPYRRYSGLPYRCGHARTPENTYTNRVTGVTSCLSCRRRRSSRLPTPAHREGQG